MIKEESNDEDFLTVWELRIYINESSFKDFILYIYVCIHLKLSKRDIQNDVAKLTEKYFPGVITRAKQVFFFF